MSLSECISVLAVVLLACGCLTCVKQLGEANMQAPLFTAWTGMLMITCHSHGIVSAQ